MCGVGVAFNARLAGVRILGGSITDAEEAAALNYDYQNNQIFSCSWGPSDDGQTVGGFGSLSLAALSNGVTNGRAGLGSIYVFASGNGGYNGDSCGMSIEPLLVYLLTNSRLRRSFLKCLFHVHRCHRPN